MSCFRLPVLALLTAIALPGAALAHELLDHPLPARSDVAPPTPAFMSGGENAKWESMGTIFTGNPHTDVDFFESRGETFAAVGTLAAGPNGGGVTFVKLVGENGKVAPKFVGGHPSASCVSNPSQALSLQHDIEATPKPARSPLNTANDQATLGDAQLILDATDGTGRCHDQGLGGLANPAPPAPSTGTAPPGGLEIIDVSEGLGLAKEIGLTSHVGQAHTVNVDPKRPHIAYAVTSDSVSVNASGVRANDTSGSTLDGWEVVDLSSCMYFPAGMTIEQKRAACRPQVYRYRYPSAAFAQGHTADDPTGARTGIFGCHELEVYPDDRLTCASGAVSLLFDMSGAFDDNGTPADFTDDKPRGVPLPCAVRPSSTKAPEFDTGAMVTDCVNGQQDGQPVDLRVANWIKIGQPSLKGVEHIGTAQHIGRAATGENAKFDSTEDIDFSHESELTHSGRYLISSDERGGGVAPPGAACDTPDRNKQGNGGLHFYDTGKLRTTFTGEPQEAWRSYARESDGDKAIYRAPIRTGVQGTICTAHVFQQIPGQNRIFMGYYSQGTQVIDFTENADGTLSFKEAGYYIPGNANEWVSAVYKAERNADGTFTYYGATGDFSVGQGRNAIDLYKVTLPAPPTPRIDGAPAPAAQGTATVPTRTTGSSAKGCTATSGLRSVRAQPRKGGLRFSFTGAASRPVDVEVFRLSRADRILTARSVRLFRQRDGAFGWRAKGLRDGVYVVRFRVRGNQGRHLAQRVALVRRNGRFAPLDPIERRATCDEVDRVALTRPVFGGTKGFPLKVAVRMDTRATVEIDLINRNGQVVRDTVKQIVANRDVRIPIGSKGVKRGRYTVRVQLNHGQTQETVTLGVIRL